VKAISFVVALLSIAFALLAYVGHTLRSDAGPKPPRESERVEILLKQLQERSVQASRDTVGDQERAYLSAEAKALRDEIARTRADIVNPPNGIDRRTLFWLKVAFSVFFGLGAMYVVLSKKYDSETQKWAFSVLTLISGVWIGTVS
jgi:hypothetical protein